MNLFSTDTNKENGDFAGYVLTSFAGISLSSPELPFFIYEQGQSEKVKVKTSTVAHSFKMIKFKSNELIYFFLNKIQMK